MKRQLFDLWREEVHWAGRGGYLGTQVAQAFKSGQFHETGPVEKFNVQDMN